MARLVGIDVGGTHVRAALLRTSYRRVALEAVSEVEIATMPTLSDAVRAVSLGLAQHSESIAIAVEGESAFIQRVSLPKTALRQLDEVLPYEVEAKVPVDIDELVFDHRLLAADQGADGHVTALTAAVRTARVREQIDVVRSALGREPERIGCGALPLVNLAQVLPALEGDGPIGIVDLGAARTEVVIVAKGEPVYGRTLSRGVAGLPESAPALSAELRQTLTAWAADGGSPLVAIHLVGGGAYAPGAEAYLTSELGLRVGMLPALNLEELTAEQAEVVPRFGKAIALALSLQGRPQDLNLRQGELSYQRGYGFLKEKVPLLSGLAAAIVISFAFASWAEYRALDREQQVLAGALVRLSGEILGEETEDPARVEELLSGTGRRSDADPMPHADAFDAIVSISSVIPNEITHDIEEFDLHRGHVKIHGVLGSTDEAQTVAAGMRKQRCVEALKISKVTKAINSERHKYVLEFDLKCPEDKKGTKKKSDGDK